MNAFYIYLIGNIDSILKASLVFALISLPLAILLNLDINLEDAIPKWRKASKVYRFITIFPCIFFSLFLIFTPNEETLAAMIVIPCIAESDVIKRDLPEIYELAVKKLKDSLTPPAK